MGTNNSNKDLILLGDFNIPNIIWDTMSGSIPWSTNFCDFLFKLNLVQRITTPTHIAGNVLDVILTKQPSSTKYKLLHHYLAFCPQTTIWFILLSQWTNLLSHINYISQYTITLKPTGIFTLFTVTRLYWLLEYQQCGDSMELFKTLNLSNFIHVCSQNNNLSSS